MTRTVPVLDPARRERRIDLILWVVAVASIGLTIVLSFTGKPPGVGIVPGIDKAEHGWAYFVSVLALLLAAVWRPGRGPGPFPWARWWIAGAALAGGALVEIAQGTLTTDRSADVFDWLGEVIGVGLALLVLALLERRPQTRHVRD